MAEFADKRQNVGADRVGEENNGFALAAVVDGEHVELEMACIQISCETAMLSMASHTLDGSSFGSRKSIP